MFYAITPVSMNTRGGKSCSAEVCADFKVIVTLKA
jgi:hypothetical protein